jgi:hypothetical protein
MKFIAKFAACLDSNYIDSLFYMLRLKTLYFSLFSLLFLISIRVEAQQSYSFTQQWSIHGYLGATNFHGDMTDKTNSFLNNTPFSKYFYQDRRIGFGIYVDKMFTPYYGIRGNLLYTNMKSTKESDKIYFAGTSFIYTLSGLLDVGNLILGVDKYRVWNGYFFLGIGYSETQANAYDFLTGKQIGSTGYVISPRGGSFRRMTEVCVPLGIGVKYKIEKSTEVFAEITRQIVLTNKLDAYPVEGTKIESLGMINLGISYDFNLPSNWTAGGTPRYNGKSPDPSIRAFNKKKKVVMRTNAYKKATKKRYKYGRKKFRKHRW